MPEYYVDSNASGAADGSSWADAFTTLGAAAAVDAAGDTIYVAHNHSESTASSTVTLSATVGNPVKVICGNTAAQPPTTSATTAIVAVTSSGYVQLQGVFFLHGITFNIGTGNNNSRMVCADTSGSVAVLKNCELNIVATGPNAGINTGTDSGSVTRTKCTWVNVDISFGSTSQRLYQDSDFLWIGGSILSGSAQVPSLIKCNQVDSIGYISAVDFSNLSSSLNILEGGGGFPAKLTFVDCKMPTSWSGGLFSSTSLLAGTRVSMYNCDSGDTNFKVLVGDVFGTLSDETTLVRTGGASDRTTGISWQVDTTSSATVVMPFITDEIAIWNETVGSSVTATIHILHDSATSLTDKEIWIESVSSQTSGSTLGTIDSDFTSEILGSGSNQASSAETWTTTGMTNPNKQQLSVTFTPQKKSVIYLRIAVAKASYTVYIDPKVEIS